MDEDADLENGSRIIGHGYWIVTFKAEDKV